VTSIPTIASKLTSDEAAREITMATERVEEARRILARARRAFPNKGECPFRAIIDVEDGNLLATARHLQAAARSLKSPVRTHLEKEASK